MRAAFLFLSICIYAGLVLASRDHQGPKRRDGHDQGKKHHQTNRVGELHQGTQGQEGRRLDTRKDQQVPITIETQRNRVNKLQYTNTPGTTEAPHTPDDDDDDNSDSAIQPDDDVYGVYGNGVDEENTTVRLGRHSHRSRHSRNGKFGQLKSKKKTT
ncbi:hypothetical protein Trydic_g2357 [Trypoxylus dichotomus]